MAEDTGHSARVTEEFSRTVTAYTERSKHRYDGMDVLGFCRFTSGESVLEVGAGSGNFLALFAEAARRFALDLTHEMLVEAKQVCPGVLPVRGDAIRLPFAPGSVGLVACAQMVHHVWRPVQMFKEMRRVAGQDGRILVVDQCAPESYEQQAFMNELEAMRDPSHAASRAPSTYRLMLQSAGLRIEDEVVSTHDDRLSSWMGPSEFPVERIARVRDFIARFGPETGMGWERVGDDWHFKRRRIMLLAERA